MPVKEYVDKKSHVLCTNGLVRLDAIRVVHGGPNTVRLLDFVAYTGSSNAEEDGEEIARLSLRVQMLDDSGNVKYALGRYYRLNASILELDDAMPIKEHRVEIL